MAFGTSALIFGTAIAVSAGISGLFFRSSKKGVDEAAPPKAKKAKLIVGGDSAWLYYLHQKEIDEFKEKLFRKDYQTIYTYRVMDDLKAWKDVLGPDFKPSVIKRELSNLKERKDAIPDCKIEELN